MDAYIHVFIAAHLLFFCIEAWHVAGAEPWAGCGLSSCQESQVALSDPHLTTLQKKGLGNIMGSVDTLLPPNPEGVVYMHRQTSLPKTLFLMFKSHSLSHFQKEKIQWWHQGNSYDHQMWLGVHASVEPCTSFPKEGWARRWSHHLDTYWEHVEYQINVTKTTWGWLHYRTNTFQTIITWFGD